MRHYCTACLNEFVDDAEPLPDSDCVHCVFCGAPIPLEQRGAARLPSVVVPFSKDYEREEAFALGVIAGTGPGFPDTLKQFRVRATRPSSDSLLAVSGGSEPPSEAALPAGRRLRSIGLSLSGGFAVGVAIAFGFVALQQESQVPPSAASSTQAPRAPTLPEAAKPQAQPGAAPAPICSALPSTPSKATPSRVSNPTLDRRWLLDRARSAQHQYRLADAERLYRQVLGHAPRDSEALSGLGELELLRGTLDLAEQRFQAALDVNADYIPALVAAADIRWQSGRGAEAQQAYRSIVEHYSADSYPPYVAQRSAVLNVPQCEH